MHVPTISEVRYLPLKPTAKGLIGIASCLFDGRIRLDFIGVYQKPDGGKRLVFPDRKLANGRSLFVYYPIDRGTSELIRVAIEKNICDNT